VIKFFIVINFSFEFNKALLNHITNPKFLMQHPDASGQTNFIFHAKPQSSQSCDIIFFLAPFAALREIFKNFW